MKEVMAGCREDMVSEHFAKIRRVLFKDKLTVRDTETDRQTDEQRQCT
jgi:hypothetical protein